MTQLDSFAITGTPKKYPEGVGGFINDRDWAKEERDPFITVRQRQTIEQTS